MIVIWTITEYLDCYFCFGLINIVLCTQDAQSLHGDIPQKQREVTLKGFRNGTFGVLVATNVAARGLDIPEVDLVIQSSPPKVISVQGGCGRKHRLIMGLMFLIVANYLPEVMNQETVSLVFVLSVEHCNCLRPLFGLVYFFILENKSAAINLIIRALLSLQDP